MTMTKGWVHCQAGNFRLENKWSVEPGSIMVLFGPSGSGKTMTLRSIVGLIRPADGRIEVGGRVVFDHASSVWVPPHERNVGYLPQEYLLFPHLDVAGNIAYGLERLPPPERRQRVAELVEAFRLQGLERRRVWELSGGQRQRVALARAMAPRPAALLLDEPFAALDMELRRGLRRELRSVLKESHTPVIIVTHDREETLSLADTVQVMDQGRIVAAGEPLPVLGHPTESAVARLVGVENLLPVSVLEARPQEGTLIGESAGVQLELPLVDARPGDRLTVGIRANDIILAAEEPHGLSARNRLPGTVRALDVHASGYEVLLDCGVLLRCHVTRRAVEALGIAPGARLWAVIKTSSLFIVQGEPNPRPLPLRQAQGRL